MGGDNRPGQSSKAQSTYEASIGSSRSGDEHEAPRISHSSTYQDRQMPSRPSRPSFQSRSITAPAEPHRLRSRGEDRGGEREWTVFGQLMLDSAQVKPTVQPRSLRLKGKPSRRSILGTGPSTLSMNSRPRSVLDDGDRSFVQTPVQEEFHQLPSQDPEDESDENDDADKEHPSSWRSRLKEIEWMSFLDLTPMQRNLLKCAVAYFLASLFTYITPLSLLLGDISSDGDKTPHPSGHMVATVAVYFNPAKTVGGMLEADLFCLYGVVWAAIVSCGSMALFWWIDVNPGLEWLAAIVAIILIGLGMTVVAGMKVWMAKPSFNTACSMTTIIIFMVVAKEGGFWTLLQVSRIVLAGAIVSNVTCYLFWPQSASTNLRKSMSRTMTSFATLLELLTNTFLISETELGPSPKRLQAAIANHQACFTSLQKSLSESKAEHLLGNKEVLKAYGDAVGCLNRLGQHLNGLRSGTGLQSELWQAAQEGRIRLRISELDRLQTKDPVHDRQPSLKTSESTENLQVTAAAFEELIDDMGPPLKALSNSCIASLNCLETFFSGSEPRRDGPERLFELTDDLQRALFTFESTSNQALMRVYRRSNLIVSESLKSTSAQKGQDMLDNIGVTVDGLLERVGADETVFQVYFFIFTLQEFAKELANLSDAVNRLHDIELEASSFALLRHFRKKPHHGGRRDLHPDSSRPSLKRSTTTLRRRISTLIGQVPRRRSPVFPKVKPHAPNTMLTPSVRGMSISGRTGQRIWRISEALKQKTVKYAFKAGMATAVLAAPAFFDSTRPYFIEYRGEWALISYFIVISPTVGATNYLGLHRLLGSLLGAAVATAVFLLFPENPIPLSIFGFFFSIPCFYLITGKPDYASAGRFILLTYNLTCLYRYNIRQRDVSIVDIAYHRSVSVAIGVIWAAFVSRYWWPAEARRELSNELSEFCLNIGWLYTHLVAANSGILVRLSSSKLSGNEMRTVAANAVDGISRDSALYEGLGPEGGDSETTQLLQAPLSEKLNDSIQTFMAMELHLQVKLIELQSLLKQAQREPRLKGPFPVELYRGILTSLQTILDRLHSMRCVTTREEWFTSVRKDFVIPVNKQRREMVGNVILYFSVLSAAFKLKMPVAPYLPPAEESRRRLVAAIRQLDVVKNRDVSGSRQLLFFAYALTMKNVIYELDFLGRTVQDAFGVIGQTVDEFESMFLLEGGSTA